MVLPSAAQHFDLPAADVHLRLSSLALHVAVLVERPWTSGGHEVRRATLKTHPLLLQKSDAPGESLTSLLPPLVESSATQCRETY